MSTSEAKYRKILQALPDLVFRLDRFGTLVDHYSPTVEHFSAPSEELLGKRVDELLPEAVANKYKRHIRQAVDSGRAQLFDYQMTWPERGQNHYEARLAVSGRDEVLALVRNITDRKRAEEALRQSEKRLELALWGSGLGLWDWNVQTGETVRDPRWAEMLGYSPEEIEPSFNAWKELAHPDDLPRVIKAVNAHLEGRTPYYETEHRLRTRSGEWKWILDRGKVVEWDKDGKPLRFTGTQLDISGHKRTEEAYRALVEHSLQGLIIIQDERIVFANPRIQEISGFTPEELAGFSPEELRNRIHPDDRQAVWQRLLARLAGQRVPRHNEFRFVRKDETVRWMEIYANRVELGGKPAVQVAYLDVTDRKRAEEALRESEREFRLLFQEMSSGAALHEIICDADGQPYDYRFLEVNPAFEELTGLNADEITGKTVSEVLPEIESHWIETFGRVALTGEPTRFESYAGALGKHFEVKAYSPEKGFFAVLFEDVTERRRAEQERRRLEERIQQVQKLESLGVLAGGIAHDFNNLLTAVLGNASLAATHLPASSTAREFIGQIEAAAQRAADLCNQMLAYSGKGRFVITSIDLSALVEEMVHMLELAVSKKAILRLNVDRDLQSVRGDVTQLRQIFMNLVSNASDAIGDASGVIAITTGSHFCDRAYLRETYLDEELPAGQYVFVEVSDTGCGMSEETRARIFDPFFTTKFTGRGLGLAAVLGIVRGHRGAIRVDSELGRGTSIRVLLPAGGEPVVEEPETVAAPESWHGSGTILAVDDEEAVCTLVKAALEGAGFQVLLARDGREALEVFRQHAQEIEAVLLDLAMPYMGGEEVLRELNAIHPGVPVILSSGFSEEIAAEKIAGLQPAGFVQKPYRPADLVATIRQAIEAAHPSSDRS